MHLERFDGKHSMVSLRALTPQVMLMVIRGMDVGEHGEAPMKALQQAMGGRRCVLFIDAREAFGPSTDVSAAWAQWLAKRRDAFLRINMLTGSRFVELTATFVRKFADLGDRMRIYTDAIAFETALSIATSATESQEI